MDKLPKDTAILVSSVNMLLRDEEFDTLESLCCFYDEDPLLLRRRMLVDGYEYSETQKQFRPAGFCLPQYVTSASIELAYSFFHQKQRVYQFSDMEWQKEDIEYAISSYVESMPRELYNILACGRADFLCYHANFADDLLFAVEALESMMQN